MWLRERAMVSSSSSLKKTVEPFQKRSEVLRSELSFRPGRKDLLSRCQHLLEAWNGNQVGEGVVVVLCYEIKLITKVLKIIVYGRGGQ